MATKKIQEENKTLEEKMKELEALINELENGELPLEKAFEKYKEGMDMLKSCHDSIDRVEKELQIMESEGI